MRRGFQAEDRCHRKGQVNAVSSTVLVAHRAGMAPDDLVCGEEVEPGVLGGTTPAGTISVGSHSGTPRSPGPGATTHVEHLAAAARRATLNCTEAERACSTPGH